VVLAAFIADMFDRYTVNESIADTLIMAAAALIGIGTFERKQ